LDDSRRGAVGLLQVIDAKKLALADVPAISARSRLQWEVAQQLHVLLYPEGMVKLSDSAAEILKHVDGVATVADIIAALELTYSGADLSTDVVEFLNTAYERGWITVTGR
jgi:pyrroloquinoline quinone biosynthesis protein D